MRFRDIVDDFYMLDPSYFVNNENFHNIFPDGLNTSFFVTLDRNYHVNIKFILPVQSSNGGKVYDLFAGFNFPPDYFESIPTGNDDWIDRDDYGFEAYTQPILGGEEDVSGTHLWTMLKF